MSRGGSAHRKLIENNAKALIEKGYEIELEKTVLGKYVVDIYALKDNAVLILECGYTDKKRLSKIREHFKVIHVPYLDLWIHKPLFKPMSLEQLASRMGIKNLPI